MTTTLNRRQFLKGAAVAPAVASAWWSRSGQEAKRRLLFAGTQTVDGSGSKGIYAYRWDPATGELASAGLAAESDNPTFLVVDPDARFLYAANELDSFEGQNGGAVSSFAIDHAGAKLRPINQMRSLGTGTCNVNVDHLGRNLFCANYTGGSATSFYLNSDGQISDPVSHFQYTGHGPNADRQEAPHAHRVTPSPDDRFLLVNDLGLDSIHVYHLDDRNAKLTANDPPQWTAPAGSGPRALRFHPNGRFAYCVCEMASSVMLLDWSAEKGTLKTVQSVNMVPDGYNGPTSTGDDIVIDRSGKFAHATNRGYDRLVSFAIDPRDGKLTVLENRPCGGKTPRHLALDPTERWLLIANQDSDTITVFSRDPKTGKVAASGKDYPLAKPQCLVWA
ncbi:MAG TPA: lactonase family protein [Acidobacteriaceae bacterium]|jgi:6-phosphogluconolactonase|nr:lactonase family protein [Acidobacteriaceae bacterium]